MNRQGGKHTDFVGPMSLDNYAFGIASRTVLESYDTFVGDEGLAQVPGVGSGYCTSGLCVPSHLGGRVSQCN